MKKGRAICLFFVFGLFLGLLPSLGEAIDRGVGGVNCDMGQKLQAAINSASGGATITVRGTCNENVVIDQTKNKITIDGNGIATINGVDLNKPTVTVQGRGITIKKFTITGGRDGVQVKHAGTAVIDRNIIQNASRYGICVVQLGFAIVINNTIQNSADHGIVVTENSAARIGFSSVEDIVASPNLIQNNGNQGIIVTRTSSARIVGNTINNNTNNGIKVLRVSYAEISDNTINGNGSNGIRVKDGSGVNLGNDITGTSIFDLPNSTTVNNGNRGLNCTVGGYVSGRLGTLNGVNGATSFSGGCINNLSP